MGYNVTPTEDGGFHIERDNSNFGCLIVILVLTGLGCALWALQDVLGKYFDIVMAIVTMSSVVIWYFWQRKR